MFLRSAFNYDRDQASLDSGLSCDGDEDQAKQEFKEECDINTILKRFNVTGQLPENVRMPSFGDFTGVHDFQSAANAIAVAREAFDEMPADIRKRFNNDPADFVAFCSDESNLAEARTLGLVPPAELEDLTDARPATIADLRAAFAVPVAPGAPAAPSAAPVAPSGSAVTGVT